MITARRVLISVGFTLAIGLILYGFTLVRPTNTPVVFKNSAVKAVSPVPAALVLRETSVAITLAPGYQLATQADDGLSITAGGASTGIPEDQIRVTPAQNQYAFLPTSGAVLSELPVGRVCAVAKIIQATQPDATPQSFSWCFQTQ